MLDINVGAAEASAKAIALPVCPGAEDGPAMLVPTGSPLAAPLAAELAAFIADVEHTGAAGSVHLLPRPGRDPGHVLLVGLGDGDGAGWRSAGAAVVRTASHRLTSITVSLPLASPPAAGRDFAEGAWLASYQFGRSPTAWQGGRSPTAYQFGRSPTAWQGGRSPTAWQGGRSTPKLRRITLAAHDVEAVEAVVAQARAVVEAVMLARDLTNTPSLQKSPKWLADRVANAAARRKGVAVTVLDEAELARRGFGGILAVGGGSARPPRLIELSWRPRGARTHVVLVGKGITFDTGGISIKTLEAMKLMRKDMGAAAAVCATVLGAADLELPVRVTALAPLAENMISGSAMRPGDVVRHYGGLTTEAQNTDAEGRVVLADALAFAVRRMRPDLLIDLATLTGASHVALGKRTAALFTHNDELAVALATAGDDVGESMWRMPLADEYVSLLASDVADLNNAPAPGQAGAVTAALYLREFTGNLREHWAHIDMSAPAWIEKHDGPLVKGATGWGVRMLLRWLGGLTEGR